MPEVEVGSGTWVQMKPGVPEQLQTFAEQIDSVATALLAILNIALTILNFVKAFLIGFLDPLIAILEAIISTIEGLLQDIRDIGIYYSGDLKIEAPYKDILGGFSAYERRMLARLVNRADPTRPDFSGRTTAVAIFLYVNVDITNIQLIIRVIKLIKRFFGMREGRMQLYSKPVGLEVGYGNESTGIAGFKQLGQLLRREELPVSVQIRWRMASVIAGGVSYPMPAPDGFLIEVSTLKEGLLIGWEAPISDPKTDGDGQETRIGGVFVGEGGKAFRLYGGYDALSGDLESLEALNSDGTRGPGKVWIYAFKSPAEATPIPLEALKQGDRYVFQRVFYVENSLTTTMVPGQGYQVTLNAEDMPYHAEVVRDGSTGAASVTLDDDPATTLYVRVSAVSDAVTTSTAFQYLVSPSDVIGRSALKQPVMVQASGSSVEESDKGPTSDAVVVCLPQVAQYFDTVTAALIVMVLSRSDLPVSDTFRPGYALTATGLEDLADTLVPQMIRNPSDWFRKQPSDPQVFRRQVLYRCRNMANLMIRQSSTLGAAVEEHVVGLGEPLLDWQWSDSTTLIGALESTASTGITRNPFSFGGTTVSQQRSGRARLHLMDRGPGFGQRMRGVIVKGSVDSSPVYFTATETFFCRNVLTAEVYAAAAAVLNIASASSSLPAEDGAWVAYKLLPQGIPYLENALQQLLDWLEGLKAAADSIVEAILAYIAFVEARILQIQALIVKINALIQRMLDFQFPSMNGLVVTGNGTDGLVSGLVTAENKPSDAASSYGAGVVVVAGGLPSVTIELLKLFFPEEG